jgi:hypothetical protein
MSWKTALLMTHKSENDVSVLFQSSFLIRARTSELEASQQIVTDTALFPAQRFSVRQNYYLLV